MLEVAASCRTCMKNNISIVNLHQPLKLEENDCNIPLAELFLDCLSVQIIADDGLPQNICRDCAKALLFIYNFRKQVLESERCYKTLLANSSKGDVSDENIIKAEIKDEIDLSIVNTCDDNDFVSDDAFTNIETAEATEKQFECHICQKQYSSKNKFQKHLSNHDNVPPVLCSFCGKSFRKQISLDKHISKHCKNHNKCNICFMNFTTETLLMEHMKVHSDVEIKTELENVIKKEFKCTDCNLSFSKIRSLAMHRKKHKSKDNKQRFQCDICKKEYKSKVLLVRHINVHSLDKQYSCLKCPKIFLRQDQFREHLRRHDSVNRYVCNYCNKAFSQHCNLKDHLRTHTGETPFLCSECGKGFNNGSNLRQHMMRHAGIKPYACSVCPKTFCTKGQMTCHMMTHTGVTPYKCDVCGASFTKPSSLKKHSLIHSGEKPFVCETCKMRFTCRDHLNRHCRIHTGEKPYKCTFCERAFTQSNDLVKHIRQHVGQNIYQCSLCYLRFRLRRELKLHYPVHYVDGEEPPVIPIDKEHVAPILMMKPEETAKDKSAITLDPAQEITKKEILKDSSSDRTITITINRNSLDKNGLAGDITINYAPDKS